jgi:4,5-DOPA dioxygenase extradiol
MHLNSLRPIFESQKSTAEMPVLFLGHGSPMNAIENNEFTNMWQELGKTLSRPSAILIISAHWETNGTFVTAMDKPKTIHDFGGFPKALFDVEYAAPGSPSFALETKNTIQKTSIGLDEIWGLDHGAWSILKHLYPAADIPVLQLSLDYNKTPQYHYELAKELTALRSKGVLIIGSGNMIHNLRMVAWNKINEPEYGYDWALQANDKLKTLLLAGDHKQLINYSSLGKEIASMAIPSPDHYLPLLYAIALKGNHEKITLLNDKLVMGSISMTSFKIEKS